MNAMEDLGLPFWSFGKVLFVDIVLNSYCLKLLDTEGREREREVRR